MAPPVTHIEIVPRYVWGARPWDPPTAVHVAPITGRVAFFVHYHGAPPKADRGPAMAKEIESIHLANGWAGVGYSFMVGQDGRAYEGRGWGLTTAACPGWNRTAWHVYVAVGGDQRPTEAAMRTVRALYDVACYRSGRRLAMTWHGAHYATECPGDYLRAWVEHGMPDTTPTATEEDNIPTPREIADAILDTPVPTGELGSDGNPLTYRWLLVRIAQATNRTERIAEDLHTHYGTEPKP